MRPLQNTVSLRGAVAKGHFVSNIVKGLNEHPSWPATKRVARLIHLFKQACDLNDSFRRKFVSIDDMIEFLYHSPEVATFNGGSFGARWTFKFPDFQGLNTQLNQVLTEINRIARRYRWHPVIRHYGYDVEGVAAFDITEHWDIKDVRRRWETESVWWLLGNKGEFIDFFRQCEDCRRWFFALTWHQKYCGEGCRKHRASCSDQFKSKRRIYMRAYRRDEKERDGRAKAVAKTPKKRT